MTNFRRRMMQNSFAGLFRAARAAVAAAALAAVPILAVVPAVAQETAPADADAAMRLEASIARGTTEEKRSALFEIRNRRAEFFARIARPALADADETVRATAAFSVLALPPAEALAALLPNLRDKSEIVRRETAYALGRLQQSAAVAPLVGLYRAEKIVEVRNACLVALGDAGDPSAVEFLTEILRGRRPQDDDAFARRAAARALGQIAQRAQLGTVYAVTPESFLPEKFKAPTAGRYRDLTAEMPALRAAGAVLAGVLGDPRESADTRREAAFALGALGDGAARAALEAGLASPDYYLAEICREALEKLAAAGR